MRNLSFIGCNYVCMCFSGIIMFDEDMSQPVSVENGVMRVRIGSTAYIADGVTVQIVCNATNVFSKDPITISWLYNGKLDQNRGNVTMITVTDANHGDVFTCVAENIFESHRRETEIIFVNKQFCIIMNITAI